jgi:hypothetical protein
MAGSELRANQKRRQAPHLVIRLPMVTPTEPIHIQRPVVIPVMRLALWMTARFTRLTDKFAARNRPLDSLSRTIAKPASLCFPRDAPTRPPSFRGLTTRTVCAPNSTELRPASIHLGNDGHEPCPTTLTVPLDECLSHRCRHPHRICRTATSSSRPQNYSASNSFGRFTFGSLAHSRDHERPPSA